MASFPLELIHPLHHSLVLLYLLLVVESCHVGVNVPCLGDGRRGEMRKGGCNMSGSMPKMMHRMILGREVPWRRTLPSSLRGLGSRTRGMRVVVERIP